jgi:hypothetical protein
MTHSHVVGPAPHSRNTFTSWLAVFAVPVLFVVGFVLGNVLVGDPNAPDAPHGWDGAWRVLVLWVAVEVVPLLGIWYGARAVRHHEHGARNALIANVVVFAFFVGVTLIGGLSDALS